MSKAKYTCNFCSKTNTKVEGIHVGFFNKKVGEKEVVDKKALFARCIDCGRVLCKDCLSNMGGIKKTWYTTTLTCPKCSSKMIEI